MNPIQLKLKTHKYAIIQTAAGYVLLCNGKPLPNDGPMHTLDFQISHTCPEVSVIYTHFGEDFDIKLCKMVPVVETDKRYNSMQWWERLSPNHKMLVKEWVNDRTVPDWIEGLINGACYLHGFGVDGLGFLTD